MSPVGLEGICTRARQAVHSIRARLTGDAEVEHRSNFAPYSSRKRRRGSLSGPSSTTGPATQKRKVQGWNARFLCLASTSASQVPTTSAEKEALIEAGLGEKRISIPDVECSPKEFYEVLHKEYPKLRQGGGFELLRCIPNSRLLEPISVTVSQSPRLLKTVINTGRVYIRPIQQDLDLSVSDDNTCSSQVVINH